MNKGGGTENNQRNRVAFQLKLAEIMVLIKLCLTTLSCLNCW